MAEGPSQRQLRVGELVRHALSQILLRTEIRDDDLTGAIITVTEVRVSPDNRNATAFIVPLGGERETETVAAMNRHRGFLRGALAREIDLKHIPALRFELDQSFSEAGRIEEALRSPGVARDLD